MPALAATAEPAGKSCTLPACAPAAAPRPTVAESGRGPLRILLADDNADFVDSLAVLLALGGHPVRVAYDGRQALRHAQSEVPDVGLFDIGMPGLDGCSLAEAVRREPGGDRCLLIAITGWGQQIDHQRALEAGFDHVLAKPVDLDALLALLEARA